MIRLTQSNEFQEAIAHNDDTITVVYVNIHPQEFRILTFSGYEFFYDPDEFDYDTFEDDATFEMLDIIAERVSNVLSLYGFTSERIPNRLIGMMYLHPSLPFPLVLLFEWKLINNNDGSEDRRTGYSSAWI
jgi:hypothetical protein